MPGHAQPSLPRVLTLRDLVLFHVVAIVGLRWYLTAARTGLSSVSLWLLAVLLFFIPQGIAVSNLARRHPEEGGVYAWTRDAFGPFHGFLCGWAYWVNNLTYYPSLVLFIVGNAVFLPLISVAARSEAALPHAIASGAVLWAAVVLNLVGLRTGRWLQNAGAIATWTVTALLVALAGWAWAVTGGPGPLHGGLLPDLAHPGTLAFWATLCFALAGLELAPSMGGEVKDPERTIPRSVYVASPAIALTYAAGTLAILTAFAPGRVDVLSGIVEAFDQLGQRVGFPVARIAAALVVLAGVGGLGAWLTGSARIPFAMGFDRYLPAFFGRVHPRWQTPHWALLVQGGLATLFIFASAIGATAEDAYLVLVNATIVVYFVPYLYLFASLIAYERRHRSTATWKTAYAGLSGLAATALAVGLAFVPPPGVSNPRAHLAKVAAQAFGLLLAGAAIYAFRRPRPAS